MRVNSFTDRLILFVTLTVVLVMVGTMAFVSISAAALMEEQVNYSGRQALDVTGSKMENILSNVMMTVKFVTAEAEYRLEDGERSEDIAAELRKLTAFTVKNNSNIVGSVVALEPYTFPDRKRFSPYSWLPDPSSNTLDVAYDTVLVDGVRTKNLGSRKNDIYSQDWYSRVKETGEYYWSDPYFDTGGAEFWMCTYSAPIRLPGGHFCGVVTADISLSSLDELVKKITPLPEMKSFLVDSQGRIVVRTDTLTRYGSKFQSMEELASIADHPVAWEMVRSVDEGREWLGEFEIKGESYIVYTRPIRYTGWDLVIFAPFDAVYSDLYVMQKISLVLTIVGLLLIVIVIRVVVKRQTRPIVEFGKSAREIASGDFDASLPVITTRDEMMALRDSFLYMQEHLKRYMEEIRVTAENRQREESELNIAHQIQMGILPNVFPPFPERKDLDLFAYLKPAKAVGGDLYDYFISDEKLYFVIGDVSGKGIPASLLMSVSLGMFHTVAISMSDPAEILSALNDTVARNNRANMFITMFVGILDLSTGVLRYSSAGHNPPLLIRSILRDGESGVSFLPVEVKLPIGLFPESYVTQQASLSGNDVLLLYTDGLTEAENEEKALYSEERLVNVSSASGATGKSPEEFVNCLLGSVREYAGDTPQSDDLTILAIKYTPSGSVE
uniref:HAMP domain-containing protein n=1 Tax=uncultured bacterium fosmid pJB65E1 TaxID=1478066 RepID=A0A0H3U7W6_9BACT|nr:hypothetical protein [uncultured bacterium fosmid pJB65E1]